MHFLFETRRYWERSSTHTFVPERDPDFRYLAGTGTGRVRTFVRVWLAEWEGDAQYVGGAWARGNHLRSNALRRLAATVVRHVGRARAGALMKQLARHLAALSDRV